MKAALLLSLLVSPLAANTVIRDLELVLRERVEAIAAPGSRGVARCLRDARCKRVFAVAHRCVAGGAPENSREGVRAALALGVPLIETDLRRSQDGVLFLLHDAALDRTTDSKGPIAAVPASRLAEVRLANGETLPRFEDLYALSRGRAVLVVDMKVNAVEQLADWIAGHGSFSDVVFFVSDPAALASAGRARARHPRMLVMAKLPALGDLRGVSAALGAAPALVQEDLPSRESTAEAHRRGVKVMASVERFDPYPGLRRAALELLLARGADCVLSNEPGWLQERLDGR